MIICDKCIHQNACTSIYANLGRFSSSPITDCNNFDDVETLLKGIKAIEVKPGDTVVWKIPLSISYSQAKNIHDTITSIFPNNIVIAIPGDSDLSVKEENDGN